jgi:DNA polymerase delta subunit 1
MNFGRGFSIQDVGNFKAGEFKVHENNIDPVLKFTAIKKICLAGWVCAEETILEGEENFTEEERKFSTCDIDMNVYWDDFNPYIMKDKVYINPTYCSFDIECYSKNHNSRLPNPEMPENIVNQISMIFGIIKNEKRHRIILSLGLPKKVENSDELRIHKCESDLLLDFSCLIRERDPDIFVGYNIMKFDWHYLIKRAELCGIYNKFLLLSRIVDRKAEVREANWSSSAYKKQEFFYPECYGRCNVDVLL